MYLKAAKVAGITDSVLVSTSTQTSGALNYIDIEVSQNKSGNTEEVLNNSNITNMKQPEQDLFNNQYFLQRRQRDLNHDLL